MSAIAESIGKLYDYLQQLFPSKRGTVNVTVTDPLKRLIKGATVQIVKLNITVTTDAAGKAVLRNIPYGKQIIKITSP
jgi:hypothetical protein